MAYQSPFTGFQIDIALAKANAALPADDASLTQLAHGAAFATDLAGQAVRSVSEHAVATQVHGISTFGASLVDDTDAATARATLALGDSATKNVGATANTVAAGDHGHTGVYALAAQGVTNGNSHNHDGGDGAQIAYTALSGLPTLGSAASKEVGTTSGTVAAGDDSRLTGAASEDNRVLYDAQVTCAVSYAANLAGQAARSLTGSVPGQPPASATAPGQPGQIAHDSEYFYLCVALNTWKRSPLTTWP